MLETDGGGCYRHGSDGEEQLRWKQMQRLDAVSRHVVVDDFCVAPVGTLMAAYGYNMGGWGRLLAAGERTVKKKAVAGGR